jgi:hypothetical protein
MDSKPNTRKAYNTDVWIAQTVKLFRDWDFAFQYNELAAELVRLEALRRLSMQDSSCALAKEDPLPDALQALSNARSSKAPSPEQALSVKSDTNTSEQPFTMSLLGRNYTRYIDNIPE